MLKSELEQRLAVVESELHLLEEVCARYADDEDAYLDGDGEPFGSITTECGLKARQARARWRSREGAQA